MSNHKITFYGTGSTSENDDFLECHLDYNINEICITINHECIFLDKSTSIKIAKTLRTEINKMEDQDGN